MRSAVVISAIHLALSLIGAAGGVLGVLSGNTTAAVWATAFVFMCYLSALGWLRRHLD